LIPLPAGLGPDVAVLAEPLGCAINVLEQTRVASGESVLIHGGGPVGLLTALAARQTSAEPLVVECNPTRLAASSSWLASIGVRATASAPDARFDVAINAAPALDAVTAGLERLAPGGRFGLFSGLLGDKALPASVVNEIHYRQLVVAGAYGCTRRQMQDALAVLDANQDAARSLIDWRIDLARAPAALGELLDNTFMKCMVRVT
jgi:threonine dehydrogenase-like Zn-dependent dehydrogenase